MEFEILFILDVPFADEKALQLLSEKVRGGHSVTAESINSFVVTVLTTEPRVEFFVVRHLFSLFSVL